MWVSATRFISLWREVRFWLYWCVSSTACRWQTGLPGATNWNKRMRTPPTALGRFSVPFKVSTLYTGVMWTFLFYPLAPRAREHHHFFPIVPCPGSLCPPMPCLLPSEHTPGFHTCPPDCCLFWNEATTGEGSWHSHRHTHALTQARTHVRTCTHVHKHTRAHSYIHYWLLDGGYPCPSLLSIRFDQPILPVSLTTIQ